MKAIILAAGPEKIKGLPKCLALLGGMTLLERQIQILKNCKLNNITVVIGKDKSCWNKKAREIIMNIHDRVIINDLNASTKNGYSLYLSIKRLRKGPVVIIDGDVIFEEETINLILNNNLDTVFFTRPAYNITDKGCRIWTRKSRIVDIGYHIHKNDSKWDIFSGILKIGSGVFEDYKKALYKNDMKKALVTDPFKQLLKKHKLSCIDSDKGKTESQEFIGGSYAGIKKITVLRKEASEWKGKLIDEVNWIKDLPRDLKSYFPEIRTCDLKSTTVFYEMPIYPYPSLRKMLLQENLSTKEALKLLENLMNFMFKKVYTKKNSENTKNYLMNIHIKRIYSRLKDAEKKSVLFKDILKVKDIYLNGKKLMNIPRALSIIKENYKMLRALEPTKTCMVHGDLHFDNILLNMNKMPHGFLLIDPRGVDSRYDYTYDLGKIWHSFHGLYDFLHEGLFDLEMKIEANSLKANLQIQEHHSLKQYIEISHKFPKILSKYSLIKNDPYWLIKTLFSEMSHFCSVMPFHIKPGIESRVPVALYLTGVKLINEFITNWLETKEWRNIGLDSTLIHLDTFDDYKIVSRMLKENIYDKNTRRQRKGAAKK